MRSMASPPSLKAGLHWGVSRAHYSSEHMSLAVLGGQPLDKLQQWVQQLFGGLQRGGSPRPSFAHAGLPFEVGAPSACAL